MLLVLCFLNSPFNPINKLVNNRSGGIDSSATEDTYICFCCSWCGTNIKGHSEGKIHQEYSKKYKKLFNGICNSYEIDDRFPFFYVDKKIETKAHRFNYLTENFSLSNLKSDSIMDSTKGIFDNIKEIFSLKREDVIKLQKSFQKFLEQLSNGPLDVEDFKRKKQKKKKNQKSESQSEDGSNEEPENESESEESSEKKPKENQKSKTKNQKNSVDGSSEESGKQNKFQDNSNKDLVEDLVENGKKNDNTRKRKTNHHVNDKVGKLMFENDDPPSSETKKRKSSLTDSDLDEIDLGSPNKLNTSNSDDSQRDKDDQTEHSIGKMTVPKLKSYLIENGVEFNQRKRRKYYISLALVFYTKFREMKIKELKNYLKENSIQYNEISSKEELLNLAIITYIDLNKINLEN